MHSCACACALWTVLPFAEHQSQHTRRTGQRYCSASVLASTVPAHALHPTPRLVAALSPLPPPRPPPPLPPACAPAAHPRAPSPTVALLAPAVAVAAESPVQAAALAWDEDRTVAAPPAPRPAGTHAAAQPPLPSARAAMAVTAPLLPLRCHAASRQRRRFHVLPQGSGQSPQGWWRDAVPASTRHVTSNFSAMNEQEQDGSFARSRSASSHGGHSCDRDTHRCGARRVLRRSKQSCHGGDETTLALLSTENAPRKRAVCTMSIPTTQTPRLLAPRCSERPLPRLRRAHGLWRRSEAARDDMATTA